MGITKKGWILYPKMSESMKRLWVDPTYREHMVLAHIGKKQSQEQIAKRIESRKGYKHSEKTKEKIGTAHLGKKYPYKARRKGIKRNFARRPNASGENHYKWLGGYSKSQHKGTEYNIWRMAVYTRDNFKCKISNEDCEGKIEAHHILSFTKYHELRYEINNGITLCRKHHPRKMVEEVRLAPVFQDLISAIAN